MKVFTQKCMERILNLARWLAVAGALGMVLGVVGGLFGRSITEVTALRTAHSWMLWLLPFAGLLIVALYKLDPFKTSTNLVLEGVQAGKAVPLRMAPLIILSTVLTHAFGGSAGREGAALQLGGSVGATVGRGLKMDGYDEKIMIMCGMSAAFSALFGTPLTATIFAIEVVTVGVMHFAALVPCAISALVAREFALMVGAEGERFALPSVEIWNLKSAALTIVLAVLCALVSIIFCMVLHKGEHLYRKYIPNEWARVFLGGCTVILMTVLLGTTDYLGAGMNIVERAIEGEAAAAAFLIKIVFTTVTLGSGYKGGEIVPALFVGATFGCLFGQLTGFSPSLAAACGMTAVFCGVTNCPIASLVLSFELFGFECMPFFLLAVSVSFLESGYFGLYHSQKILYSKTKFELIDQNTK